MPPSSSSFLWYEISGPDSVIGTHDSGKKVRDLAHFHKKKRKKRKKRKKHQKLAKQPKSSTFYEVQPRVVSWTLACKRICNRRNAPRSTIISGRLSKHYGRLLLAPSYHEDMAVHSSQCPRPKGQGGQHEKEEKLKNPTYSRCQTPAADNSSAIMVSSPSPTTDPFRMPLYPRDYCLHLR